MSADDNESRYTEEFDRLAKTIHGVAKSLQLVKAGRIEQAVITLDEISANAHTGILPLVYLIAGKLMSATDADEAAYALFHNSWTAAEDFAAETRAVSLIPLNRFNPEATCFEISELLNYPRLPDEVRDAVLKLIDPHREKAFAAGTYMLKKAKEWYTEHIVPLEKRGISIRGKEVLEIGSGVVPFMSLLYLFCGANVVAADKFRGPECTAILNHYSQMLIFDFLIDRYYDEILAGNADEKTLRLKCEDVVNIVDNKIQFVNPGLKFIDGIDSGALPFDDSSFDFVFSLDTLEHVGDPEGDPMDTVREIARVLRPGGWSAHRFGPIDHRDIDNSPYDHFKFSEEEWKQIDIPHNQRNNRRVLSWWRKAFSDAGLEEVSFQKIPYSDNMPPLTDDLIESFHPDFKKLDREDLETVLMAMILRKPE